MKSFTFKVLTTTHSLHKSEKMRWTWWTCLHVKYLQRNLFNLQNILESDLWLACLMIPHLKNPLQHLITICLLFKLQLCQNSVYIPHMSCNNSTLHIDFIYKYLLSFTSLSGVNRFSNYSSAVYKKISVNLSEKLNCWSFNNSRTFPHETS